MLFCWLFQICFQNQYLPILDNTINRYDKQTKHRFFWVKFKIKWWNNDSRAFIIGVHNDYNVLKNKLLILTKILLHFNFNITSFIFYIKRVPIGSIMTDTFLLFENSFSWYFYTGLNWDFFLEEKRPWPTITKI